jgi:uncharacterized Zn finger protein (UPF0148 family)
MQCKHPYYHIVDGKLVCVQCGEPSPRAGRIEDKIDGKRETKAAPENAAVKPAKKKAGRK